MTTPSTTVDEIADGIYRLSTWVPEVAPPAGFTFNQFLIAANEPLLFHTGPRGMFPLVSEAVARVVPVERLRWITFGHVESDECGSMNEWLAAAPQAEVAHGVIGCLVSLNDLAGVSPNDRWTVRPATTPLPVAMVAASAAPRAAAMGSSPSTSPSKRSPTSSIVAPSISGTVHRSSPTMWLTRARTSQSEQGVGAAHWSPTESSRATNSATVRRCKSMTSMRILLPSYANLLLVTVEGVEDVAGVVSEARRVFERHLGPRGAGGGRVGLLGAGGSTDDRDEGRRFLELLAPGGWATPAWPPECRRRGAA